MAKVEPTRSNAILLVPIRGSIFGLCPRLFNTISMSSRRCLAGMAQWYGNGQIIMLVLLTCSRLHFIFSKAVGAMKKLGFRGSCEIYSFLDYPRFEGFRNKGIALKHYPVHLKGTRTQIFCKRLIMLPGERQCPSARQSSDLFVFTLMNWASQQSTFSVLVILVRWKNLHIPNYSFVHL